MTTQNDPPRAERRFVIQMAGWMGSGKSTLARAVASEVGAVVLDHDTTKSALLGAGVPHPPAGAASYDVLFAVAADLLEQAIAVVIDSPSAYASVPERGAELAHASGVPYFFVECSCPEDVAAERIGRRTARASQVVDADAAAAIRASPMRTPHRPETGALVVDTAKGPLDCRDEVLSYLEGPGASGPAVPVGS